MTQMVQVALAGDVTEAEELQELLKTAGIDATLEPEDEADALKVMVPEDSLEDALETLEALTDLDDDELTPD
jgi:type III secretory pathway lipoprotein EscJ